MADFAKDSIETKKHHPSTGLIPSNVRPSNALTPGPDQKRDEQLLANNQAAREAMSPNPNNDSSAQMMVG